MIKKLALLALTTGMFAASLAGTASAQTASQQPAKALSCSVINIGLPGNVYYGGEYAGQVEQQYNTCNGLVSAHWQWAGGFQNSHPGAWVDVEIISYYSSTYGYGGAYTYTKDVSTGAVNIHSANPDAWHARAIVNSCGSWALGTEHWYGGQDWDGPHTGGC